MSWQLKPECLERFAQAKQEIRDFALEEEASKKITLQDPVQWTESVRILKGKPFSFKDRDYLLPIYRDTSKRVIIVKARQMEMTEWLVNWLLHKLTTFPFTTGVYAAPRMDQVSRFSQDRFRRAMLDSSELRNQMISARDLKLGETAITRVPFSNGSVCYLLSAWGDFGAIRNIPADYAAIDEMQDVQGEAIPVLEECMSHSQYGFLVGVGTASNEGDPFSTLWEKSDKKEWEKKATAWIPQKPENKFYSGYHIDQRMAFWITRLPSEDPNSLEAKRARYSDRRYANEVLGLFYRGLAKPLIPEDMLACCDRNLDIMVRLEAPYQSYAGIDWGGGEFAFTVIWIMAKDELDRWRLLYCHKFSELDPMKQVEIIGNMMESFNVKQAVADIGYGAVQVSELQKRFAGRVYGCQYIRNPAVPLEKVKKDEFGKRVARLMVNADRSFWIEKAIQIIKKKDPSGDLNPGLVIPWHENAIKQLEWIIDHFTCLEMEEEETVSGKKYHRYTHPQGQPDDASHGFVYALIADALDRLTPELSIMDLFG